MLDLSSRRVCVTGGAGFLGRAVCAKLRERGLDADRLFVPRSRDYDLTTETGARRLYEDARPDVLVHLAAEVGGIGANREQPGRFFYANMAMGLHLVEGARRAGIERLVFTGTVCSYPKFARVPFEEDSLWDGYPEETNAPYGIAKKSLLVMLDGYKRQYALSSAVVVPTNLYGPHDNFDPASSHVIPALIRKCEEARVGGDEEVRCWGTGRASRDFLYVEDAAEGVVRAAERLDEPVPVNLGTGREITIEDLARTVARLCGFEGRLVWDPSKPDGQPRRRLDITRARRLLDWGPETPLEEGLKTTIAWWRETGRGPALPRTE